MTGTLPDYSMQRTEDPNERNNAMTSKAKAAVLITAIIMFGFVLMSFSPNAKAATGAGRYSGPGTHWVIPQCAEDQVITRRGRCIDADDATTYFRSIDGKARGYWYDRRNPRARYMKPAVPACYSDQVILRSGRCWHIDGARFRGGYWFAS